MRVENTLWCMHTSWATRGDHTLFKEIGAPPIAWKSCDLEAMEIRKRGPLCAIYESTIFEDLEALSALASDGNLNSTVELGEDEMQAFGRVDQMFERMFQKRQGDAKTEITVEKSVAEIAVEKVIAAIQVIGFGQFCQQEWEHCIALRMVLPTNMANICKCVSSTLSRVA